MASVLGAELHGRGARRAQRIGRTMRSPHPRRSRRPRGPASRRRSALARARPVPVHPGRAAGGRLRPAVATRAAGPPPRGGPLLRGRAGSDERAGVVASHYLDAFASAPDDADRAALATQARAALEAAASRSTAIGAHASAAGYLADAVELADEPAERARLLELRSFGAGGRRSRPDEAERPRRELVDVARASGDRGPRGAGRDHPDRRRSSPAAGRRSRGRGRGGATGARVRSPTRIPTGSG